MTQAINAFRSIVAADVAENGQLTRNGAMRGLVELVGHGISQADAAAARAVLQSTPADLEAKLDLQAFAIAGEQAPLGPGGRQQAVKPEDLSPALQSIMSARNQHPTDRAELERDLRDHPQLTVNAYALWMLQGQ